ncbi:hypothetical protein [Halobellus ordinarius]|uniref:hypothetical protein n=1 Tax=Halobellus ordinarius TaxID=3075120 RepID=UPI002880951F|nr:hypothetical protein [Halobellus sp. ZY16]
MALGTILTIYPTLLSYLELAVPLQRTVIGFSGLNMALLGYTLVEFSTFLQNSITRRLRVENAPRFFFPVLSFILARYADSTVAFVVLGVSLLITVLYWLPFLLSLRSAIAGTKEIFDRPGYFELAVVSTLTITGFIVAGFPQRPTVDSGFLNIYSHLLGFSIGFITFYIWSIVTDRKILPPDKVR